MRRKRLAEEAAYERKREAEGLPSQEELRRLSEERDKRFIELSARIEASRVAEEYERLRREVSLMRSQLNLLSAESTGATSTEASYPLFYSYPLFLPRGHRSPFLRHGTGRHATHGRTRFPPVSNPFHPLAPGGWRGRRTTGGASIHLRFGSPSRAPHSGPRGGRAPGSGGRR